jgi:hypothetical protein
MIFLFRYPVKAIPMPAYMAFNTESTTPPPAARHPEPSMEGLPIMVRPSSLMPAGAIALAVRDTPATPPAPVVLPVPVSPSAPPYDELAIFDKLVKARQPAGPVELATTDLVDAPSDSDLAKTVLYARPSPAAPPVAPASPDATIRTDPIVVETAKRVLDTSRRT